MQVINLNMDKFNYYTCYRKLKSEWWLDIKVISEERVIVLNTVY